MTWKKKYTVVSATSFFTRTFVDMVTARSMVINATAVICAT